MDISQLLDLAKEKSGSYTAIAEAIGKPRSRLSEFKNGRCKANASEVAAIALIAEVPVWKAIAEIESKNHPALAGVWKRLEENRVNR